MRQITFIITYYDNPLMLKKQWEVIGGYPSTLKENMELILMDDCSPNHPMAPVNDFMGLKSVRVFRSRTDVPWNSDACRNYASTMASNDWMLLMDIDHIVPVETMQLLILGDIPKGEVFKFNRLEAPGMTPKNPAINLYFLTKRAYQAAGGYDERLAGTYGTDADFAHRLFSVSPPILLTHPVIFYGSSVIPDATTSGLKRKSPENSRRIQAIMRMRSEVVGWKPWNLTFEYDEVKA